jgi:putative tryptophan/tyrosine transport system substrate-binding protein
VAQVVIDKLRDLGYLEGRHVEFEIIAVGPDVEARLAAAAARGAMAPDVYVGIGNLPAKQVRKVVPGKPLLAWAHDAVKSGLVPAMARPGGMVTGVDSRVPEAVAKRVELVLALQPRAKRIGMMFNPDDDGSEHGLATVRQAAARAGVQVLPLEVRGLPDIERVLAPGALAGFDAVLVATDAGTSPHMPRINHLASAAGVPTLCEFKVFVVRQGCSLSYGMTFDEFGAIAARQIDRIFKGTAPGDIPMEYPTRYELVLHAGRLQALGLKLPQELHLRADEVLQ